MKLLVILLALTLAFVNGQKTPSACTYNNINYGTLSNGSYSTTSTDNQYRFYWNICGAATQCGTNSGMAACQIKIGASAITNVGNLASGTFKTVGGVPGLNYITNSNGCASNTIFRSITILLKCGTGSVTANQVSEESKCTYDVTMTGKSLCGGSNPTPDNSGSANGTDSQGNPKKSNFIGGGWIFIIILLSCTVVYIIAGVIFNAKVKHQHGSDMFPNKEMWVNFGGLIKDGVFFIKSKVTGTKSGYQQV